MSRAPGSLWAGLLPLPSAPYALHMGTCQCLLEAGTSLPIRGCQGTDTVVAVGDGSVVNPPPPLPTFLLSSSLTTCSSPSPSALTHPCPRSAWENPRGKLLTTPSESGFPRPGLHYL